MKAALTIFSALMILTYASTSAAFGPLDAEAGLGIFSKYVWRGMLATDGAVVQPEASASLLGFELGFWANMDLDDANGLNGEFNEIDYIMAYELALPLLELEAGLIHYAFPHSEVSGTTEVYAAAAAKVLLNPSLTLFYDLDEVDAAYLSAGVSHGVPLSPMADLKFSATLGYGTKDYVHYYFGAGAAAKAAPSFGSGPTDLLLGLEVPYHPVPLFTVSGGVFYSTLLGDASDAVDSAGGDKDTLYFGVSAQVAF